jgi:SET domain-containing protein
MAPPRLEIRATPSRGRGVFAVDPIPAGVEIENAPVIVVPRDEVAHLVQTVLHAYHFLWGGTGDESAIALGYGSLYNHSTDPNAMYVKKTQLGVITFVSLRPIAAGEEITVSYNGGIGDRSPVWFEVR